MNNDGGASGTYADPQKGRGKLTSLVIVYWWSVRRHRWWHILPTQTAVGSSVAEGVVRDVGSKWTEAQSNTMIHLVLLGSLTPKQMADEGDAGLRCGVMIEQVEH